MASYTRLTFEQRLTIERHLHSGASQSAIARKLDVHRSTVCNELNRNGGKNCYSARLAQRKAEKNATRNYAKCRGSAHRFPLDRGGIYSKEEPDFSKARPRAWRFRKYLKKIRRKKQGNTYYLFWQALQEESRYRPRRRRNHIMEGLKRTRRSLSVFQSYGSFWNFNKEGYMCSVRYIRHYTLSHKGIIKLHYRDRGLIVEQNDHRSPWRGHLRYEIQNPVKRSPRKTVSSLGDEKPVGKFSSLVYCYHPLIEFQAVKLLRLYTPADKKALKRIALSLSHNILWLNDRAKYLGSTIGPP